MREFMIANCQFMQCETMFTGIIEEIGKVKSIRRGAKSVTLEIEASKVFGGTEIGDSIATNGVCLTVTSISSHSPRTGNTVTGTFDVMPETVSRTSLASLKPGSMVNLERALTLQTRLGGHMVSGHVDGTGRIVRREQDDNALWLWVETTPQIMHYIIEKGSIAVQGISLTVAKVEPACFAVSLIPHTQQATTLHSAKVGDTVNLENDIIAKYVEKLMPQGDGISDMEKSEEEKTNLYKTFLMA